MSCDVGQLTFATGIDRGEHYLSTPSQSQLPSTVPVQWMAESQQWQLAIPRPCQCRSRNASHLRPEPGPGPLPPSCWPLRAAGQANRRVFCSRGLRSDAGDGELGAWGNCTRIHPRGISPDVPFHVPHSLEAHPTSVFDTRPTQALPGKPPRPGHIIRSNSAERDALCLPPPP